MQQSCQVVCSFLQRQLNRIKSRLCRLKASSLPSLFTSGSSLNDGVLILRMADVSFAYRFCLIRPRRLSASGQWPQETTYDPCKPPIEWHGTMREWHLFRSGQPGTRLRQAQVTPRADTVSLVWCQMNQRYWVVPEDCTRMVPEQGETEQDVRNRWQPLQCSDLRESQPSRPGLWQLNEWGSQRQHSSTCPQYFDEFLPTNFFTGKRGDVSCHFIGGLSLILALMAMCPRDPANIVMKIDNCFYRNNQPVFWPAHTHQDRAMDRHGKRSSFREK